MEDCAEGGEIIAIFEGFVGGEFSGFAGGLGECRVDEERKEGK